MASLLIGDRIKVGVTEDIILRHINDYEDFYFETLSTKESYDVIITNLDTKLSIDDWISIGRPTILSPTTDISYLPKSIHGSVIKLDPSKIKNITATAEHTFLLYLFACRNMGNSTFDSREKWTGIQVNNKNAAIFGRGRIGSIIENYCRSFNMKVSSFDKEDRLEKKIELLKWADVVFVCMTYDDTTTNFFNVGDIDHCKKGQIFINTSRPKIVSKKLVLKAVESKVWKNYCMDFLNQEDDNRYIDKDYLSYIQSGQMIVTPHIAGNTKDSFAAALDNVISSYRETLP